MALKFLIQRFLGTMMLHLETVESVLTIAEAAKATSVEEIETEHVSKTCEEQEINEPLSPPDQDDSQSISESLPNVNRNDFGFAVQKKKHNYLKERTIYFFFGKTTGN